MGVEVERKFLVSDESWRAEVRSSTRIVQGYLAQTDAATVRVRVKGDKGFLTIKGAAQGIGRSEFEYEIPLSDAQAMLRDLCVQPPLEKVRHLIPFAGHLWELDVFEGANAGLVMAEIELTAEDEPFDLPDWAGDEVTGDPRYFNAYLAHHPFATW